jgi:ribosomal protein S18 acetylase RimI-like enzyme
MVNGVAVRTFGAKDRIAVVALWREVFANDPPWNEPEGVIDRKLKVQPELFLVAEAEGRLIGTVLGGFDGVRGWVHHLAVARSHRRNGIGRLLMQAAEEGLRRMGCPKVNLQVRATNLAVIEFYRALGYNVEERASLGKRLGAV